MGTNYYTSKGKHIGKKSAAGKYCWDCKITLCKGGIKDVHTGHSEWFDSCPECYGKPKEETLDNSAAGRELGFNKQPYKAKTGVASCSSFTWAIQPDELLKIRKIIDEYDRKFTIKEFIKILEECPIRYFNMIDREFS